MKIIHMQTEQVEDLARRLVQAGTQMQQCGAGLKQQVQNTVGYLQGGDTGELLQSLYTSAAYVEAYGEKLTLLARFLSMEIVQWLEVDGRGRAAFSSAPAVGAWTGAGASAPGTFDSIAGIFRRYDGQQSAAWAVMDGRASTAFGTFDYSVLSAEAMARGGVDLYLTHIGADGQVEIGAYAAKFGYNHEILGADIAALAYLGATAGAGGSTSLDLLKGSGAANFKAEAFAGGRASGELSKKIEFADGIGIGGGVEGGVSYGVGAKFGMDAGFSQGSFKFDMEFGACLGLGLDFGTSFELDLSGAGDLVMDTGKALVSAPGKAWNWVEDKWPW